MHRVLSFQMARGFGESSEFVTKRICFSFLFSIGFLCLLCGFLTGRFAAGRAVDMRAEKMRLQLAGNGLEYEDHLRQLLVRRMQENSFTANSSTNERRYDKSAARIKEELEELQIFHKVVENRSCIAATIRGSREPDRYVILSTFGEGITILIELSKALNFVNDDYDWNPRRTIIFLISVDSSETCRSFMNRDLRFRIVSYIELDAESISANGHFVTTGSDIVQSTILQASSAVENPFSNDDLENTSTAETCRKIVCTGSIPRLDVDVPNALVKFTNAENSSFDSSTNVINAYSRGIGEVVATSIWRLSEMTLFQWDPRNEINVFVNIIESLSTSVVSPKTVETIVTEAGTITRLMGIFNEKVHRMETLKSLEVRMANDLSMQIRRTLLCNDQDSRSRTDLEALKKLKDNPSNSVQYELNALFECYKTANQLLQEDIT